LIGTELEEETMDRQDTYVKTEKGSEEIRERKYKLPQAMRSLLNMIDGTTTAGAFLSEATALGDVASMLAELEKQGFIKKTEARPQPPPPPSPKEPVKEQPPSGDGALIDVVNLFTPSEDKGKKDK
jgi:DNA-binding PadR family transcriptional regulator